MDIKALISQMTLEEKAGLCSGLDFWHTTPVERLGVPLDIGHQALVAVEFQGFVGEACLGTGFLHCIQKSTSNFGKNDT